MSISRNTFLKSFFWKFFEKSSAQIAQFVIGIILARLLMPEDYGAISMLTVFIVISQVIINGGFNTALVQKKGADNTDFSTVFYFSMGIALVIYVILYICAPFIADFYAMPELISPLRVLSLVLFFNTINSIQRAYVSKKMLFKKLFYCSLLATILSGSIGIYLAYNGFGIWALVAQALSHAMFTTAIMWFSVKWRPIWAFSKQSFRQLFEFGWKILTTNLITQLFMNIRRLIIGKYYSPADLAYYDRGDHMPSLVTSTFFESFQTVLFPVLSDDQNEKDVVKSRMRRSTKFNCFIIYPLMVGLIVTAKPLIVLLLTEKWIGVVPFMQILCIANFFRPITISNAEAIKALGYSDITLKLEIIKKIIDMTILIISATIGVMAIAWGCVLYNFICLFINLYPNIKLLNYSIVEQIKDATPTLLISLLMGAIVYFVQLLPIPNIAILTLQVLLGGLLYAFFCKIFKEESFMYTLSMIKEFRNKRK